MGRRPGTGGEGGGGGGGGGVEEGDVSSGGGGGGWVFVNRPYSWKKVYGRGGKLPKYVKEKNRGPPSMITFTLKRY